MSLFSPGVHRTFWCLSLFALWTWSNREEIFKLFDDLYWEWFFFFKTLSKGMTRTSLQSLTQILVYTVAQRIINHIGNFVGMNWANRYNNMSSATNGLRLSCVGYFYGESVAIATQYFTFQQTWLESSNIISIVSNAIVQYFHEQLT